MARTSYTTLTDSIFAAGRIDLRDEVAQWFQYTVTCGKQDLRATGRP